MATTTLEQVLHGRDTISSKDAKVTVTIDGNVINLIDCKELKINIKKNKEKVQVLGDHWTKHKTTSVDGTGTLGQYVINSNWLKYGIPYTMKEGDLYFTITFAIDDPTSHAGKQIIQLDEVNLDEIPIADFKADDSVMDISADFTFEGIHLVQPFDGIQ